MRVLLKNRVEADKMGVSSGIRNRNRPNRPNHLCLLTSGETRLIGKSAYLVTFSRSIPAEVARSAYKQGIILLPFVERGIDIRADDGWLGIFNLQHGVPNALNLH